MIGVLYIFCGILLKESFKRISFFLLVLLGCVIVEYGLEFKHWWILPREIMNWEFVMANGTQFAFDGLGVVEPHLAHGVRECLLTCYCWWVDGILLGLRLGVAQNPNNPYIWKPWVLLIFIQQKPLQMHFGGAVSSFDIYPTTTRTNAFWTYCLWCPYRNMGMDMDMDMGIGNTAQQIWKSRTQIQMRLCRNFFFRKLLN